MQKSKKLMAVCLLILLLTGGCTQTEEAVRPQEAETEETARPQEAETEETARPQEAETEETARPQEAGTEETARPQEAGTEETVRPQEAGTEETAQAEVDFELSETGKDFLQQMCYYMPDFAGEEDWDEAFWQDFLFYSYTGRWGEDTDMTTVKRQDLGGYEETVVKVSREEFSAYVKLALGTELPVFEPSFEDMEEGRTALFYRDGYYYIGVSDFGDFGFSYRSCEETGEEEYRAVFDVVYADDEEENGKNTVEFLLRPCDNENGFVIRGKEMKKG